jgi:hypothetical protein
MSSVPEFFEKFPINAVTSAALTETLAATAGVKILFLWGYQCPNCDVAKRAMLVAPERLAWPYVTWLHCNVYEDAEMATRFSLHGVPVFMVFQNTKSVGRITGWPGMERFCDAIETQRKQALLF